ncbi:division/cell wall cluster transcriptional repressor MraZ [Tabrizicola soli]|uniref:Transcriptional regulator MraZ n=1 Tax=Tabrizicola soli TaxID=2185115 RepID=A0ABV7DST9_9RHOB|nr:division/cell wall cluster transcriptional repressor MraZ [Tabrizicola soli]
MAEAFRGEFYQKVDAKARVSIPAAFRAILNSDDPQKGEKGGARLYLVYGGKARTFVECYSKHGADRLAEDIEAMEMGSPERTRAERDLISRSVMVEIDADGRIVLPPRVREKMGFAGDLPSDAEAAFAGFTNRFRLYRREVYDAELAEDDEDDDIDPLTLVGRHKRTG